MSTNNFDYVSSGRGNSAVFFPCYGERTRAGYQTQRRLILWQIFGDVPLYGFTCNDHANEMKYVYIIAWFGVLFKKNSLSNYSKRKIGPSPKDEGLFSFE